MSGGCGGFNARTLGFELVKVLTTSKLSSEALLSLIRFLSWPLDPGIFILTPDWWPRQALAYFHGAHGAMVKGIVGDPTLGAYSIVVSESSSTYHDLDVDQGVRIWYSANRPHASTTPTTAGNQDGTESADTRSLRQAIQPEPFRNDLLSIVSPIAY
jgi:hypothetical protein